MTRGAREVTITHLGRGAEGVVGTGRDALCVRGALPGERVRVGAATRERGTLFAPLLEVLSASPDRRAPKCTVIARCGGCPLAHASRAFQLRTKATWLTELLAAKHVEAPAIEHVAPEPAEGYRVRARLAWQRDAAAERALIGYRAAHSREVIEPTRCEVLRPALEQARRVLTEQLAPLLQGEGTLHLGLDAGLDSGLDADLATSRVVIGLVSEAAQPPSVFAALEDLVRAGDLCGASVRVGGASVAAHLGDARERSLDLDARPLEAGVGGFRQGHAAATHALGQRVMSWGAPEGVEALELHAGHGHFTLALAARAHALTAVELDAEASSALRDNLARHALEAQVRTMDAAAATVLHLDEVRRKRRPRPALVVLDPPRAGALEAMRPLTELGPARIVYVSCDPATFARDAAVLTAAAQAPHVARYRLQRLALLDLFPDTLHVELVALFEHLD